MTQFNPYRNQKVISKLKKVWQGMFTRCYNPSASNYHRYGGRDIKICKKWFDFLRFYIDVVEAHVEFHVELDVKPTIDRIDNDGDYEPSNCRWIDPDGQLLNSTIWEDSPIRDKYKDLTYKVNDYKDSEVEEVIQGLGL